MRVLVTGAAGFIGSHLSHRLLDRGDEVLGYDNLNDYYDPTLKDARLARLLPKDGFRFVRASLEDRAAMEAAFDEFKPQRVVNLAAQAGVRYSLENPHAYIDSNIVGFTNILEGCRHHGVQHLAYASSSSVYGGNTKMPFEETDAVDHPVSLYAATKKANELMAHTYSHLYGLPTTALRFFTVYGPWGRPDMAPMLFARAMLAGEPIKVFNHGQMQRDFTYIDDIVDGVVATLRRPALPNEAFDKQAPQSSTSWAPYRVFNIGHSEPVQLMSFIRTLEAALGVTAQLDFQPMAPGDVPATYADVSALQAWTGVAPHTDLATGIGRFVDWYRAYHG